jgi:hypothetical protein
MADAAELYPSSAQDSEPEFVDPQIPAISPLQICDNDWRTDLTLHLQAPRFGLMLAIHKPKLLFLQHFPAGIESSHLQCVEIFMHHDRTSHLLLYTNAGIPMDAARISDNEMKKWIGIMFVITLSPIFNIEEDWREKDDGFIPVHSISMKSGLSMGIFKFIRNHFATGAVGGGGKTFDSFRPIQTI